MRLPQASRASRSVRETALLRDFSNIRLARISVGLGGSCSHTVLETVPSRAEPKCFSAPERTYDSLRYATGHTVILYPETR
jgi:hypothetical protein